MKDTEVEAIEELFRFLVDQRRDEPNKMLTFDDFPMMSHLEIKLMLCVLAIIGFVFEQIEWHDKAYY
eukprot:351336-Pleurochrysis_carterae.AAC.1